MNDVFRASEPVTVPASSFMAGTRKDAVEAVADLGARD